MKERHFRLLLWCIEGIGSKRLSRLIDAFGNAEAAISSGPEACAVASGRPSLADDWRACWPRLRDAGPFLGSLDDAGIGVLERDYAGFPDTLTGLGEPAFLFFRGDASALSLPLAGVVGTRSVGVDGVLLTRTVVDWCVDAGWGVISGGALGVDTEAHRRALERGAVTVAVMPAGLNSLVPSSNRRLFEAICDAGGCLVSEHPPWRQPQPKLFARRNRLISGLSGFVVVVRAPRKSGALITAEWARKQGRPVYVVPGSPSDPTARGCLDALEQGAKILSACEALPQVGGVDTKGPRSAPTESKRVVSDVAGAILGALAKGVSTLDEIAFQVDATPRVVVIEMTKLLVGGLVEQIGPGQYRSY